MTPWLSQTGYGQLGLQPLREVIAARYSERGLPTHADEVMIVNGALSGLALVLRMLTGPGDRVVVDHPTYPLAIAAIQGHPAGRLAYRSRKAAGTPTALPPRWRRLRPVWHT